MSTLFLIWLLCRLSNPGLRFLGFFVFEKNEKIVISVYITIFIFIKNFKAHFLVMSLFYCFLICVFLILIYETYEEVCFN